KIWRFTVVRTLKSRQALPINIYIQVPKCACQLSTDLSNVHLPTSTSVLICCLSKRNFNQKQMSSPWLYLPLVTKFEPYATHDGEGDCQIFHGGHLEANN